MYCGMFFREPGGRGPSHTLNGVWRAVSIRSVGCPPIALSTSGVRCPLMRRYTELVMRMCGGRRH